MAKHMLYNVSLVVNSVDLSDHVETASIIVKTNKLDAAAMSELEDYSMPGTKAVSDPTVTFYQDLAAAKVYATIYAVWTARTTFNLVGKVDAGANAATNPAWTIPVFVAEMPFLTGKRGDRHMAPVTFAVAGVISVATS